jgi:hypothetical protein
VNWSAREVGDVPPGVVTVMSTVPASFAGEVAVHEVVDEQLTLVPAVPPKLAVVPPTTKPVPVMVTPVPPTSGPALGDIPLTNGLVTKVNLSAPEVAEVPPAVATVTSTVPASSDGEVAVHEVVDEQLTLVPAVLPKLAVVAPTTKPVPVMVTAVPPPSGPVLGEIPVMTGAPKMNLSAAEVADVPPPTVVTVRSTVPAASSGEVAVHEVVDEQLTEVPAVPPKLAVVEPTTKLVPVIVTTVPPPTGPTPGVIAVTTGGRLTVWVANADGPPLLDTVWPVKTWVVEVPPESVTVRVAVHGPAVA